MITYQEDQFDLLSKLTNLRKFVIQLDVPEEEAIEKLAHVVLQHMKELKHLEIVIKSIPTIKFKSTYFGALLAEDLKWLEDITIPAGMNLRPLASQLSHRLQPLKIKQNFTYSSVVYKELVYKCP